MTLLVVILSRGEMGVDDVVSMDELKDINVVTSPYRACTVHPDSIEHSTMLGQTYVCLLSFAFK